MKDALISELSFCLSGVMVQFDTLMKEAIERGVPIHPSFPDEYRAMKERTESALEQAQEMTS